MPFTNYLDQMLVQHFLSVAYTAPADVYVAVSTTTPTQAKGGTSPFWNFSEPGDVAYARKAVPFGATGWTVPSAGEPANGYSLVNLNAITFAQATTSWGTLIYGGFFDSSTVGGGNLLGFGALTQSQTIASGDTFQIPAQQLVVVLN